MLRTMTYDYRMILGTTLLASFVIMTRLEVAGPTTRRCDDSARIRALSVRLTFVR